MAFELRCSFLVGSTANAVSSIEGAVYNSSLHSGAGTGHYTQIPYLGRANEWNQKFTIFLSAMTSARCTSTEFGAKEPPAVPAVGEVLRRDNQGNASVIWRASQIFVGFWVTSKWMILLRSWSRTIRV